MSTRRRIPWLIAAVAVTALVGCDDDGTVTPSDTTIDIADTSTDTSTPDTSAPDTSVPTDTNDTSEPDATGDATDADDATDATDAVDASDTTDTTDATDTIDTTDTMMPTCGNGALDAGETCDGTELDGQDCTTQGFDVGTLACNATCDGFDTSACMMLTCGDGTVDAGEDCDGAALGGQDCTTLGQGFTGGTLACDSGCRFDTAACTRPTCGDGLIEGTEICDGTNLGGQTCAGLGQPAGTLRCNATCDGYDTSSCGGAVGCGDGVADTTVEVCDGSDLGVWTGVADNCAALGYASGATTCLSDCSNLDVSACSGNEVTGWSCPPAWYQDGTYCDCGCGIADPDCTDATATSCGACGNPGACDDGVFDCSLIDPNNNSQCVSNSCGNGTLEGTEACDGAALNGATCVSLGYDGGTLACAANCAFDTSGCTTPTAWTCDPTWFGTGDGCDCGCGIVDPDCADATAASCVYCGSTGACDAGVTDCSLIDPTNNATCIDTCGDGVVDGTDSCDGVDLAGETCETQGFNGGALACDATCGFDTSGCGAPVVCGDGAAQGLEACDGADLLGQDCTTQGFTGGTLACNTGCTGFDTSACTIAGWTCNTAWYNAGDGCDCGCGIVDPDCADTTAANCDYCGSTGACDAGTSDCSLIDPNDNSQCIVTTCGDNTAEGLEFCDGTDLAGETCSSQGFSGGTLACTPNCDAYDFSGCGAPATCGDNTIAGTETCDGTDLGGATCASLGYGGGTLTCNASCDFDTSGCTVPAGWTCNASFFADGSFCDCGCGVQDPDCADNTATSCDDFGCGLTGACDAGAADCSQIDPNDNSQCLVTTCGDSTAEGLEACDGTDLLGQDCASLGFVTGTLSCDGTCQLDTSGCASTCGDGIISAREVCDGANVAGLTCADGGYDSGTLVCNATCDGYDFSACTTTATCGDSVAAGPEVCDGADFGGADCTALGFTGGSLACDSDCLGVDISGCTGSSVAGWTCPPDWYGAADGCDCGCGIVDPDCDTDRIDSCDYCNDPGSCSDGDRLCPGTIDPTNNAVCIAP